MLTYKIPDNKEEFLKTYPDFLRELLTHNNIKEGDFTYDSMENLNLIDGMEKTSFSDFLEVNHMTPYNSGLYKGYLGIATRKELLDKFIADVLVRLYMTPKVVYVDC